MDAVFTRAAVTPDQYPPDDLPMMAIIGRSNVGKSSLINRLLNRRNLARTSSAPGKTRTVNFYLVEQNFYLVDLPGYGYAKVSHSLKSELKHRIGLFLDHTGERLFGAVHLLDIRHPPSALDLAVAEWMAGWPLPILRVATKADKISRGARARHIAAVCRGLKLPAAKSPIVFSALSGEGKREVWAWIRMTLEKCRDRREPTCG